MSTASNTPIECMPRMSCLPASTRDYATDYATAYPSFRGRVRIEEISLLTAGGAGQAGGGGAGGRVRLQRGDYARWLESGLSPSSGLLTDSASPCLL